MNTIRILAILVASADVATMFYLAVREGERVIR